MNPTSPSKIIFLTQASAKNAFRRMTLSKYNSVAHVDIIVIWHLSSLARLSSFRNRKVLRASCMEDKTQTECASNNSDAGANGPINEDYILDQALKYFDQLQGILIHLHKGA